MKRIMFTAIILLALPLAACAPAATHPAAPSATQEPATAQPAPINQKITPQEAKQRLDSEQGIVLLDVRTAEEYAEGHIKGSVLMPLDDIPALAETKLPDKDAVIFIYCRSGRRSAIATEQLAGMGYTELYDLGGINDWPYGVVTE